MAKNRRGEVIFSGIGGFGNFISIGMADNKFHTFTWSWDYTTTAVWVVLGGNLFANLGPACEHIQDIYNILSIARKFIGPTATPVVLQNLPPYSYLLSNPVLTPADVEVLKVFICRATYAGVLGLVYFEIGAGGLYGSVHGPVVGDGIYGSVHGVVPGAAEYGHVVAIGTDNC